MSDNEKEPDLSQSERIPSILGDFERRFQVMEESQARISEDQSRIAEEQVSRMRSFADYFEDRIAEALEEKKSSPENKTSQDVRKLDATRKCSSGWNR